MSVTLGPGIIRSIFDGIERPLNTIEEQFGAFIGRGSSVPALDLEKEWDVTLLVKPGDRLSGGAIYAQCPETPLITHKMMVPPALSGEIISVKPNGKYHLEDEIAVLRDEAGRELQLTLCQRWPIRTPVSYTHLDVYKRQDKKSANVHHG